MTQSHAGRAHPAIPNARFVPRAVVPQGRPGPRPAAPTRCSRRSSRQRTSTATGASSSSSGKGHQPSAFPQKKGLPPNGGSPFFPLPIRGVRSFYRAQVTWVINFSPLGRSSSNTSARPSGSVWMVRPNSLWSSPTPLRLPRPPPFPPPFPPPPSSSSPSLKWCPS